MGKLLIIVGIFCIAVGLLISYGPKIPFLGKLPGDITIESENYKLYFPIVTCIVISVLLSLAFFIYNKLKH